MKILYLNVRSLAKHYMESYDLIEDESPDVFFLTESWLTDVMVAEPGLALPQGFSILTVNRESRGGGIAVIFKSCHRCSFVKEDVAWCKCARFVISFSTHS